MHTRAQHLKHMQTTHTQAPTCIVACAEGPCSALGAASAVTTHAQQQQMCSNTPRPQHQLSVIHNPARTCIIACAEGPCSALGAAQTTMHNPAQHLKHIQKHIHKLLPASSLALKGRAVPWERPRPLPPVPDSGARPRSLSGSPGMAETGRRRRRLTCRRDRNVVCCVAG